MLQLAPIAAFIGGVATNVATTAVAVLGKKIVINSLLIVAFIASYGAVVAAVNGLLNSIGSNQIPPFLVSGFSALPSNTDNVISIIIAIKFAVMVFRLQTTIIWIKKV